MNVVSVSTYVIKYEKQTEFQALMKEFLEFKKANPKAFEEVKSFRLFQKEIGGVYGSYVEMWEFKSKEDMEKFNTRMMRDMMRNKEMKKIDAEFQKMVDHTTLTQSIWNTVV
jgi:hypothetical protein